MCDLESIHAVKWQYLFGKRHTSLYLLISSQYSPIYTLHELSYIHREPANGAILRQVSYAHKCMAFVPKIPIFLERLLQ